MVTKMDTKINQLTNKMHQYGGNISHNNQYGVNNNKNNLFNSNNTTTKDKFGGVSVWGSNSVNIYVGGNSDVFQVNPCIISKGCPACGDNNHFIKDCKKGHVYKLVPPEGQVPIMVTTSTGIFNLY